MANAYEQAGVNIAAGDAIVQNLKSKMSAQDAHVLGQLGGFAGAYELDDEQLNAPVLVAGSDGVGTKVLLASATNRVATIGQDLIAMCVNDLLAQGALPLFFLDYLALAEVKPDQVNQILNGILSVCRANGIVLLGGETAEMPGVYQPGHFDLAGFAVGLSAKSDLLNPVNVKAGDVLIGMPSSGLHSNGFSLVRKLLFTDHDYQYGDQFGNAGQTLIDELLTPTRLYVPEMKALLQAKLVSGAAHITGGGFIENVPRMLPAGLAAEIDTSAWQQPEIFTLLTQLGHLTIEDRYLTFNMGIGMVLAVRPDDVTAVQELVPDAITMGKVVPQTGEAQVKITGAQDVD